MKDWTVFSFLIFSLITGLAQSPYTDFIGAGHTDGIVITTSDDMVRENWPNVAGGIQALSGQGLHGKYSEVARFLHQASMGFTSEDLEAAVEMGIPSWIDYQLGLPRSPFYEKSEEIRKSINAYRIQQGEDENELPNYPAWTHFRYAWWQNAVHGPDQLRQRVAFALSEILVVSDDSNLGGHGDALGSYYDLLAKHAFGNYRDLLYEVTFHPAMGFYLSHLNNPREIPEENIHPDQNYAREIMQLFTIGLFELNTNGSRKVDGSGNPIPTYTNSDIEEFAKIFTGFGVGATYDPDGHLYFGRGLYGADLTKPMIMYEDWHQEGEKHLLNGYTVPGGQSGIKDVSDAIDHLFNHPNVGPFICHKLIQRLVTSNPTDDYIERVAQIFNDDGTGVRGNLQAVVRAILLDDEARSCASVFDPQHGKMVEPVLRNVQFLKAIGFETVNDQLLHHGYSLERRLFQHPLASPSVFNFFSPEYTPSGPLGDQGLVAPEFQIYNSLSALDYPNMVFQWSYYEYPAENWESGYYDTYTNAFDLIQPSLDHEVLINELDKRFCNGNLSLETRAIIKEAIAPYGSSLYDIREKINMAIYLVMISPDYLIQK